MRVHRSSRTITSLAAAAVLFFVLMAPVVVLAAAAGAPPPQEPEAHAGQDLHAAREGELHAGEEAHEAEPKPWFHWPAKWFNFIALCGFLYWVLIVPPAAVRDIFSFEGLRVILAERGAAIIASRDLAAQQSVEAARTISESEQRLSTIEEEVTALVSDARRDAEREKERALEDGKLQAGRIIEVAEREVSNERVTANRQLRAFVADLAVGLAEKTLAEHLTPDDQDRLIRDYLSRLGESMA